MFLALIWGGLKVNFLFCLEIRAFWNEIGHSKKVFSAHEKGPSVYPRKVEIQIHSICPKSLFQVRLLWPEESDLKNTLILCLEYEAEAIHGFYAVLL